MISENVRAISQVTKVRFKLSTDSISIKVILNPKLYIYTMIFNNFLFYESSSTKLWPSQDYLTTSDLPSSEIFYGALGICPAICHPVICLFSKVAFPNKSSINPKNDLLPCDIQQPLFEVTFTVCKYKLIDATSKDSLRHVIHHMSHTLYTFWYF